MYDIYVPKGIARRHVTTICKMHDWGAGVGTMIKANEIKGVNTDRLDDLVRAGLVEKARYADGVYYNLTEAARPIMLANN